MEDYRYLDSITSDVMFEANGKDLDELFRNSAIALSKVICQIEKVKPEKKIKVHIRAKDAKELLYEWLQEIIASVDIEGMFFSGFDIKKISDTELLAEISGEDITPEKGETVVKAVTNYNFTFEKNEHGYRAVVCCDI